jgi:hypothetical protein
MRTSKSGGFMQFVMTALAVAAGMVFSLAIALLAEELIFGKVFCLFLLRRPIPIKEGKR